MISCLVKSSEGGLPKAAFNRMKLMIECVAFSRRSRHFNLLFSIDLPPITADSTIDLLLSDTYSRFHKDILTISHHKKAFWPNLCVGSSYQLLGILDPDLCLTAAAPLHSMPSHSRCRKFLDLVLKIPGFPVRDMV